MTARYQLRCWLIAFPIVFCWSAGQAGRATQDRTQPLYGYRVVNTYPHDSKAYTQGLVFSDGFLFESTGLHGRSTLRKVQLQTGRVVQQHAIDTQYFAEGLRRGIELDRPHRVVGER